MLRRPQDQETTRTTAHTQKLRQALQEDIKAFLKNGGKIKKVRPGKRSDSPAAQILVDFED